ncbi:MAG: hypothetical protein GF320_02940 [Armatimonadia bacterium]|nr:hypothetical protein [Armatimonadia bacterium]
MRRIYSGRQRSSFTEALKAIEEIRDLDGLSMVDDIDRLRARLLEIQLAEGDGERSAYHEAVLAQAIDRMRRTEMQLDGMVEREAAAEVLRVMMTVVYRTLIREAGEDEGERLWSEIRAGLGKHGFGASTDVGGEAEAGAGDES